MVATNPSSRPGYSRVYWITPAGAALLQYLDYVDLNPTVSADIPAQRDGMHPENRRQLVELFEELAQVQGEMIRPMSDSRFEELRLQVQEIRRAIAEIEGE